MEKSDEIYRKFDEKSENLGPKREIIEKTGPEHKFLMFWGFGHEKDVQVTGF